MITKWTTTPSSSSLELQLNPAYCAVVKAANTLGYLWLIHLTWRFCTHHLDWQLAIGCVFISACWLILTKIRTEHLLQTYFDVLSRIEIHIPMILGTTMSAVALLARAHAAYHYIALLEIGGWIYIYMLYRHNKLFFQKQGYGPVPKLTWINPPASVLQPGDLILTSGRIAKRLHESVGHAETVLLMPDGQWMAFSSYMDKGTQLHPLSDLTGPTYKGYYIALHLKKSWTDKEQETAAQIAQEMVRINQLWAEHENSRSSKIISYLPLPQSVKELLKKIFHASGYDWFGTFMGRVADDHWTCIGACLWLYNKMGVQTKYYGTGLLGFGTTLFDPIMPIRFLSDPAFELIRQPNYDPALQGTAVSRAP